MTLTSTTVEATSRKGLWQKLRRKPHTSTEPRPLPEPWHCIVHLKLMRSFSRLRSRLVDHFISPSLLASLLSDIPEAERRGVEDEMRHRVWQMYLEKASDRFEAWWKSLAPTENHGECWRINISTCSQSGDLEALVRQAKPMHWSEKNLPPLDVIMILHSYMLNPRCFLEDCIRFNMLSLWKAGMPWQLLDRVIDTSADEYLVSSTTQKWWINSTGRVWDIRQDRLGRVLPCPTCIMPVDYSSTANAKGDKITKIEDIVRSQPVVTCRNCNTCIDDDQLKVYKLHQAIKDLRTKHIPMPGTILNIHGVAQSAPLDSESFVLNRILQGDLGKQVLDMTDPQQFQNTSKPRLSDVLATIERSPTISEQKAIRVTLRRVMLPFSESYSAFMLDLPAAVVRQCVFIDMMQSIDWLHSPALDFTIKDLLSRYLVFFRIMEENKNNVAVPTHAVDLAWHTHQLSPASYYQFSIANASGVLIDHDDRIEEGARNDAFDWTSQQYKQLNNGKDYGQCLCWYCATAYEVTTGTADPLPVGGHGHAEIGAKSDLEKLVLGKIAAGQFRKLEEDFNVACLDADKHGHPLPNRKEYLESYTWLYPRAIPVIEG